MERRPKGQGMTAVAGRRYIINARNEYWSYTTISGWLAKLTVGDDKFKIVELNPT
jgi:hypothetical protein